MPAAERPNSTRTGDRVSGIVLDGIRKEFGNDVVAVESLSLEIDQGEFMVLVGPSGCGKSTTLRMVAGLEQVSAGRIWIGGEDVTDLPPRKRDIAMVFQNYALYAHMSVRDNIGFGLRMAGLPKREIAAKVEEAARMLGIEELLRRKPKQLSGGQRQRVAMGRAIVREPSAFLMDEPLSNLDAKLRVEMRGEITAVQRRVATPTLYVTHDQTEAMTMGDRVAILRDGVLEQIGAPAELYEQPVNTFVASFIGSPAMNLIPARCELDGDRCSLRVGASSLTVPWELARRRRLDRFADADLIVGIRPEDLAAAKLDGADQSTIEVLVSRAESMGAELFVYFQPADGAEIPDSLTAPSAAADSAPAEARTALTARVDRRAEIKPGQPARIAVDCSRLYFFDPDSGAAIL